MVDQGRNLSEAFCMGAAISTAYVNGVLRFLEKKDIIELCIKAMKNYMGKRVTGIREVARVNGIAGYAMNLMLKPKIRTEQIKIPDSLGFVVANSLSNSFRYLGKKLEKKLIES